jgi:L-lysine 2,3-aminomutase
MRKNTVTFIKGKRTNYKMTQQESVWDDSPSLKSYTLSNFRTLPQIQNLSEETQFEMEVVGNVLPFKANNYVVEQLIDWNNIPNDPIFVLTFPQKGMLKPEHYKKMETALKNNLDKKEITAIANEIRLQLNPHPAGQMELNVPTLKDGTKLYGMQHKYKETCLFFPSQSQTCHAYCSFCFRWPQFVGMDEMKFAMQEGEQLVQYVRTLIDAKLPNLKTIRIGTKALAYWPYKFLTDSDSQEMLDIFKKITDNGLHLAFMAHFNHLNELSTDAVKNAIKEVRKTGAQIRTQSPILAHINDDAEMWAKMWTKQVQLGCIPYYMFVVRDTGAQHYFGIPLVKAYEIFKKAYSSVSGLARTVRGPSMSATPGKVHVIGTANLSDQKVIVLRFLQGRNPDWVQVPFFAKYDENAIWLDDLKPALTDKFFFDEEMKNFKMTHPTEDYPES